MTAVLKRKPRNGRYDRNGRERAPAHAAGCGSARLATPSPRLAKRIASST